jgi:hypothetical protein
VGYTNFSTFEFANSIRRFFVTFFAASDAPLTALRPPYAIAVPKTTLFLRQIKHLLLSSSPSSHMEEWQSGQVACSRHFVYA